jgi:hypothetical protein
MFVILIARSRLKTPNSPPETRIYFILTSKESTIRDLDICIYRGDLLCPSWPLREAGEEKREEGKNAEDKLGSEKQEPH